MVSDQLNDFQLKPVLYTMARWRVGDRLPIMDDIPLGNLGAAEAVGMGGRTTVHRRSSLG